MKKVLRRIFLGLFLLVVCYAALQDQLNLPVLFPSWQDYAVNTVKELHGPYSVIYVTDGDTIRVNLDGTDTYVRLIGIDAPESASHNPEVNTEEGVLASEYLRKLVPAGRKVWLEYDETRKDQYDRVLAYVWLDAEGKDMLEVRLLEAGMVRSLHIAPNDKYQDYFRELEQQAKDEKAGLWATDIWN